MYVAIGITHLVYVDDLLLFARGDESTIKMIIGSFRDFGDVERLRLNLHKPNIYFASVDDRTRTSLLYIVGFQHGSFPFRSFGNSLGN